MHVHKRLGQIIQSSMPHSSGHITTKHQKEFYWFSCRCLNFICFWRSQIRLVLCGQYGHCKCGSLPHSTCTWRYRVVFHRYTLPQVTQLYPSFCDRLRPAENLWARGCDEPNIPAACNCSLNSLCWLTPISSIWCPCSAFIHILSKAEAIFSSGRWSLQILCSAKQH